MEAGHGVQEPGLVRHSYGSRLVQRRHRYHGNGGVLMQGGAGAHQVLSALAEV
jgi:hypothetical protein